MRTVTARWSGCLAVIAAGAPIAGCGGRDGSGSAQEPEVSGLLSIVVIGDSIASVECPAYAER